MILNSQFIYDSAPFPSCHAATLVETTAGGIVAAFFGGTHERHPDVCVYVSHLKDGAWSAPQVAADGVQPDGPRQPTWNPVLFQPRNGPLMLFYKVGPNPRQWWGMVKTSDDGGRTWADATRLPDGILGPIKNKPIQLNNGDIISPTSIELFVDPNDDANPSSVVPAAAKAPESGWHVYFERSRDGGKTWTATPWVAADPGIKAIQPSILVHSQTRLQAIGRTKSAKLFETWSQDAGKTWNKLTLTALPNCNSGTDAVTLSDGRHLLVYNHSATEKVRYPLNVAVTTDGKSWEAAAVLDAEPPGQYSYPSVIQSSDGLVHAVYTWKRQRIKHAIIDPARLKTRPIIGDLWPAEVAPL